MKHFVIPAFEGIRSGWNALWDWLWNLPPEQLVLWLGVISITWFIGNGIVSLAIRHRAAAKKGV